MSITTESDLYSKSIHDRKYIQRRPWLVLYDIINWYPSSLSESEKKMLKKIDRTILPWTMLTFFIKYLDQSNLTNAYVTGMEEDLGFVGNQLNWVTTWFFIGYVIAQVPLLLLLSRPKITRYGLPTLEILWGLLTLLQSQAKSPYHLYVIRFFMGICEAPVFGATHFVLGSWYTKSELFKRAGLWFTGNSLGSLFAGVLQTAAYSNLNGKDGRAGWAWGFIIDAIISLPVGFAGYWIFPGLPDGPRSKLILSESDINTALERKLTAPPVRITPTVIYKGLKRYEWWLCISIYVFMIQMSIPISYMALWLKSVPNGVTFSESAINNYPSGIYAITALSSWIGTSLATIYHPWSIFTVCSIFCSFGYIVMIVWDVSNTLKFVAWYSFGFTGCLSPLLYSWINVKFSQNREFRAFIIGSMMSIGYSTYIWTPLLVFQTGGNAPRWKIGWPFAFGCFIMLWALMMVFYYLTSKKTSEEAEISQDDSSSYQEDLETPELSEDFSQSKKNVAEIKVVKLHSNSISNE
ncbi:hypothetical protein PACTADRAFT_3854 [Pachysolen tannophilus NRRL Y-2460]|uniref:Major facilitator superfamily (MFS) profile domain-containing protein n=1 Tax=Pachysolen tannophilus NRRL Y-2460 TaxID=669874 RepID=A0A1E4TTG1_PACTA|nr:hypothetical protein PACTADRAFT_3854 [Pachysolen tannophilus NRRL Y-2460]